MRDIRKDMDVWSKKTYSEQLTENLRNGKYDPTLEADVRGILNYHGLNHVHMTGGSIQKLDKTEEEGRIHYVDIFDRVYASASQQPGGWSPLDVVYEVSRMARDREMDDFILKVEEQHECERDEAISLIASRAIRAIPSYLREQDLVSKLERVLQDNQQYGVVTARVLANREIDQKEHADAIIMFNDQQGRYVDKFYCWSFLSTEKAKAKFEEKFYDKKFYNDKSTGAIVTARVPEGHHLLFPCDLDKGNNCHGWVLYNAEELNKFISRLNTFVNVELIYASFSPEEILASKENLKQQKKILLDERKKLLETGPVQSQQPFNRKYSLSKKEYEKRGSNDQTYNAWRKKHGSALMTAEEIHAYEQQQKAQKEALEKEQKEKEIRLAAIDLEISKIDKRIDDLSRGLSLEASEPQYDEFCLTSKGENITEKVIQNYQDLLKADRDEHIQDAKEHLEETITEPVIGK